MSDKSKKTSLVLTLSEEELNEDYNKMPEIAFKDESINNIIDEIITEDTKDYYKEAPNREGFRKVITSNSENEVYENGISPYTTETKEEIEENITNRVIRKLNQKKKEHDTRRIETLEDLQKYIQETNLDSNSWRTLLNHDKVEINLKAIFQYVLSQIKEENREELKTRFENFAFLLHRAKQQNSVTLRENAERKIVEIEKEIEAYAKDYKTFFLKEHIDTVLKLPQKENKILHFCQLEKFPRVIPNEVLEKLKKAEASNLFNEFWILYLDYSKEKLKTTSEKIKEKDPILFGKILNDSVKYYYIADWIDELCDFTLEEMVKQLNQKDPKFQIPEYKGITPQEVSSLYEEIKRKDKVLKNTNSFNWRTNYEEEKKKEALPPKKSFKQKFKSFFKEAN